MTEPKGLTWNQNQLKILKCLQEGDSVQEASEKTGLSVSLCKKVNVLKNKGMTPGEVTDEMIAQAPPPVAFGEYDLNAGKKTKPKVAEQAPSKVTAKPTKIFGTQNIPVSQTTLLQFVAQQQPIPLTVDIYVSYMVAVKNGFMRDIASWLGVVSGDFWHGRGRNMYEEMSLDESVQEEEEIGSPA